MGETLRSSVGSELETMVEALPSTLASAMSGGQTSAPAEAADGAADANNSRIVALIDSRVAQKDVLLSGLNDQVSAIVVDSDKTLDQVFAELFDRHLSASKSSRLAIVAHGNCGEFLLGSTRVSTQTISSGSVGESLAGLGDRGVAAIDLYTCFTGKDRAFVRQIEDLAGIPVFRAPRIISTNRKPCGHKNAAMEAAAQENIISTIDEFP
jgi:hypothetical protein